MKQLEEIIGRVAACPTPAIELIRRTPAGCRRLGVFASSFNPVTKAHLELMRRATAGFALDEMLALASVANADKSRYEASMADRLRMLALALKEETRASIGLSSHAFFVDMIDALKPLYRGDVRFYFILGFDTFARVVDRDDRYTSLYHRAFQHRGEALEYLLTRSRLIVAGRAGAGDADVQAVLAGLPEALRERVSYLDFPTDLGEQSATQVRNSVRQGSPIAALVAPPVERYIRKNGLYRPAS